MSPAVLLIHTLFTHYLNSRGWIFNSQVGQTSFIGSLLKIHFLLWFLPCFLSLLQYTFWYVIWCYFLFACLFACLFVFF